MQFVSRADWGARAANSRTPAPGMDLGIGVHWLGPGSSRSDHGGCVDQMAEVQAFHMGPERGWADFAYNAAACRHGYVFEGRGPRIRNAANGGGTRAGLDANAAWASILYLEGTDGPGLTAEGRDAINDAAEWLGVAGGEWLGHRDFLSTECPGDRIYGWVHSGHPRGNPGPDPEPTPEPEEPDVAKIAYPLSVDAGERRRLPIVAIGGGFGWTRASVTFASAGVDVRRAVIGPKERPVPGLAPEGPAAARRFDGRGYVDLKAGDEWIELDLGAGEEGGMLDLYVEAADG